MDAYVVKSRKGDGMQVVLTTIEPGKGKGDQAIDAYEYTVHSHTYNTDEIPSAKFSYDMSPIQVCHVCMYPKFSPYFGNHLLCCCMPGQ